MAGTSPAMTTVDSARMETTLILAQQIGVHDPTVARPGVAADLLDLRPAILQLARDENFVGGADIGAPVDVDARVFDGLERAIAIEHDHDVVSRHAIGQQAPGGDVDGPADAVEGD